MRASGVASAADALAVLVRGIAACPGEDERGAVLDLLPYAVPVLRDRLGPVDEAPLSASDVLAGEPNASASASRARTDPREPSEEIRAKLHRVFRELLVNASQSSGNSLAAYASDAVLVLQFTAEDAFWEVAHEACVLLEALCDELGRRLSPVAKKLAWTFAPNLTHRRSKVRVATLRALRALMHCGAHETILDLCAFKHPNLVPIKAFYGEDRKVNYFGKLALDSCAPVRLAFVETLGDWMTTLVERADHEPRLLPYVMSAAADEAAAVRDAAAALLATLGAQYEREHEKDLKATMTYAPEHFGVEHSLGRDDSDGGDTSDPGDEEPRVLLYPPPFASRPGLGARVLVKNNFPAVVNPILAERWGGRKARRAASSSCAPTWCSWRRTPRSTASNFVWRSSRCALTARRGVDVVPAATRHAIRIGRCRGDVEPAGGAVLRGRRVREAGRVAGGAPRPGPGNGPRPSPARWR